LEDDYREVIAKVEDMQNEVDRLRVLTIENKESIDILKDKIS
jgi:hypothetical protein